jgi:DNA-binding NarL/FixJ family response regulator
MDCQLLADGLERQGLRIVESTANSREFLAAVTREDVDVAVIGSTVDEQPGRGFDLLKAFRGLRPSIPVVMLLESSKREVVVEAFRAGARGIFCKQESLDGLRKCMECVHRDQIWANREQLSFALEALASTPSVHGIDTKALSVLSKREHEVVQCVAEGLTNREIGQRLKLSPHTVKNYLFRIFDKVGVSGRVELLFLSLSHPVATTSVAFDEEQSTFAATRQAAEAGSPDAQFRLASMYRDGRGVARDLVEAYTWLLIAENSVREISEQLRNAKSVAASGMESGEIRDAQCRASEWLRAAGKTEIRPFKITPGTGSRALQKVSSA